MALLSQETPAGVDKHPDDVQLSPKDVEERSDDAQPQQDYDVETVDKVYKKLDYRIIPGMALNSTASASARPRGSG